VKFNKLRLTDSEHLYHQDHWQTSGLAATVLRVHYHWPSMPGHEQGTPCVGADLFITRQHRHYVNYLVHLSHLLKKQKNNNNRQTHLRSLVQSNLGEVSRYQNHQRIFIARQHTAADARYWYSNYVRPSVRLSVRDTLVLYENGLTYRHSFSTIR